MEYYIELERGAGSQPSDRMLAALARALRLSRDERDHLYRLANRSIPHQGGATSHVHSALLDLLTRIDGTPAMVSTDLHTVLVQNPLAIAMLGDLSAHRGRAASFIYRWFTDPASRQIYPQEDLGPQSRSFVADLRAAVGRRSPGDAEATKLVDELLQQFPEFQALWADQDVEVRRDERKRILHPTVGLLDLDCLSIFSEDDRRRLLWFTPRVGTDTAEKLALGSTTLAYTATDAPSATPRDNATDVQTTSTTPALLSGLHLTDANPTRANSTGVGNSASCLSSAVVRIDCRCATRAGSTPLAVLGCGYLAVAP